MTNAPSKQDADYGGDRRDFLYVATGATGAVAVGAAAWPLIDSMNPSRDVVSMSTVRVDLSGMTVGQRITVQWQGHPVFVWRRLSAAIEAARAVSLDELIDPIDHVNEDPNHKVALPALDKNRTADAAGEWLVVIGVCTHLGCIPLGQRGESMGDYGGWFCPCHGSHYDTSGRIRKGPAPRNLDIPPYTLDDKLQLEIGT